MTAEILAGHSIVRALEAHLVERVFIVPGESFLGILDGLADSTIDTIVCRHEGGAAYMAEAHGKLTGHPGVAMVTRGPGAANAMVAVHAAHQDATPLVLFIGLIPRSDRDRFSFQEFDPRAWFGTQSKAVYVLDDPHRASETVAEAFTVAATGRPGPVIVGVPEDVLLETSRSVVTTPRRPPLGGPNTADLETIADALANSERPALFLGGPHWTPEASRLAEAFAVAHRIPVIHDWRASDRVPSDSACNAGWVGYGCDPIAAETFAGADLLIAVGPHLSDVPTDGYRMRQEPDSRNILVSLDPQLLGNSGPVLRHVLSAPKPFFAAVSSLSPGGPDRTDWFERATTAAASFRRLEAQPRVASDPMDNAIDPSTVFAELVSHLPDNPITTFGAGNHTAWAQRFLPTPTFPSQLSMRNGSMGYSVPAAIAASLEFPERLAVAVCGDGELLMNGQELATAVQYGSPLLMIVLDNGVYGTIRDHQNIHFPSRPSGIALQNPDFAGWARSFGAHAARLDAGSCVSETIAAAIAAAINERRPALVHVVVDPELDMPGV